MGRSIKQLLKFEYLVVLLTHFLCVFFVQRFENELSVTYLADLPLQTSLLLLIVKQFFFMKTLATCLLPTESAISLALETYQYFEESLESTFLQLKQLLLLKVFVVGSSIKKIGSFMSNSILVLPKHWIPEFFTYLLAPRTWHWIALRGTHSRIDLECRLSGSNPYSSSSLQSD